MRKVGCPQDRRAARMPKRQTPPRSCCLIWSLDHHTGTRQMHRTPVFRLHLSAPWVWKSLRAGRAGSVFFGRGIQGQIVRQMNVKAEGGQRERRIAAETIDPQMAVRHGECAFAKRGCQKQSPLTQPQFAGSGVYVSTTAPVFASTDTE